MKSSSVDQVEQTFLKFLVDNKYKIGDTLPGEVALASQLGIARPLLREVLSRLRLIGLIKSRPHYGMTLQEPQIFLGISKIFDPYFFSESSLLNILEFRSVIEIGAAELLASHLSDEEIKDLAEFSKTGISKGDNVYDRSFDVEFHRRLYSGLNNMFFRDFYPLIQIAITYIERENLAEIHEINRELKKTYPLATHDDIIEALYSHDGATIAQCLTRHFHPYRVFIDRHKKRLQAAE